MSGPNHPDIPFSADSAAPGGSVAPAEPVTPAVPVSPRLPPTRPAPTLRSPTHRWARRLFIAGVFIMVWWASTRSRLMHRGPLVPPPSRVLAQLDAIRTLDGAPWTPTSFQGKPYLLNIWATWCGPCIAELPELDQFSKDGHPILSVSVDKQAADVTTFLARRPFPYPVYHSTAEAIPVPGKMRGIPTSLLVDRQGRIAKVYVGPAAIEILREDWAKLLAE